MACLPLPEEQPSPSLADALVEFFTEIEMESGHQHAAAQARAKRMVNRFLQRFGGGRFRVPSRVNYTRSVNAVRRNAALLLIQQGTPMEEIIHTLHISRATLYRYQGKKS